MSNISEAAQWVSQRQPVYLHDNTFFKEGFCEKLHRYISSQYELEENQKILDFIKLQLLKSPEWERQSYLKLGDALITRYSSNKNVGEIVKIFDRSIAQYRDEIRFSHPLNQIAYQKWVRYGMPSSIFKNHPDFCEFLESTSLLSQIKVTKYPPIELGGEPTILVNGFHMPWSDLKTKFEMIYSKRFRERFLVHKETREIYTFLDNGKGLQPHHPFLTELNPISQLTLEEYTKVLKRAHSFVRPDELHLSEKEREQKNKDRVFILQAVTSFIEGSHTRATRFLCGAKHPYLRLIVGKDNPLANTHKGEVYEVGFGWKSKVAIPFITTQGQFRTPDLWEYVNCDEKIVTNIPITQEEARALYFYTIKYHRDGVNIGNQPAFHLGEQNCSTYTRMAIAAVGIAVPTEISLAEILQEIAPELIREVGKLISTVYRQVAQRLNGLVRLLPKKLQHPLGAISGKVSGIFAALIKSMAALSLVPVRTALGGGLGSGGEAFVPLGYPERRIEPSIFNWKNWFKLSSYRFNLPTVFQRWQREQASTVIYHRPVKFTIVPE